MGSKVEGLRLPTRVFPCATPAGALACRPSAVGKQGRQGGRTSVQQRLACGSPRNLLRGAAATHVRSTLPACLLACPADRPPTPCCPALPRCPALPTAPLPCPAPRPAPPCRGAFHAARGRRRAGLPVPQPHPPRPLRALHPRPGRTQRRPRRRLPGAPHLRPHPGKQRGRGGRGGGACAA